MVMGQLTTNVDVAVIGAGPGGYTAAIRAAQLGLEVALIEKNELGGICTNLGCIPSKALVHAADVRYDAESPETRDMGIHADVTVDLNRIQKWKDDIVKGLREGIGKLCKMNGVQVIKGNASFISSESLSVETESGLRTIHFKKAIIATGTTPREMKEFPADHEKIINSDDVFSITKIPKSVIIVGGGYIAAEMANIFSKFGTKVTIVYRGTRLLKRMEPEISRALMKRMKELGIDVLFESTVEKIEGDKAVIKTGQEIKELEFEKILFAIGRDLNYPANLRKTKVQLEKNGRIRVDQTMRTTDENIYAIGDIASGPQLAHKAFRQGKVAAEVIAGQKSAYDNVAVPMVVFSDPEIASVGLGEEEAGKEYKVKTGKMPFNIIGRARTMNRTEGFVKIVADEHDVVLGVHIAGARAGTLIAEAALAIEMGAQLEDIAATIHTHPTMPEAISEAAEDALEKAIHIYRKKN